nr:hypothetical protein [Chloroflexota bacterium]
MTGRSAILGTNRTGATTRIAVTADANPELPGGIPALAAAGVASIVALLVASTPIGSGDYGQWLMVSRWFGGAATPDYRALTDVPPLVPSAIAWIHGVVGDPLMSLHVMAFVLVIGLGLGFHVAGSALDGRSVSGLLAVVAGLLVTDRYLELLAFGGLLQAAAIVFMLIAIGAFSRALHSRATERLWWVIGCVALFGTCLTHVPTATIALPVCMAAAAMATLPRRGERLRARLRSAWPLVAGFALIGVYWLLVIAPASLGYVANPASLAYRGPERVIELLAGYAPTIAIIVIGLSAMGVWLGRLLIARQLPDRRDARLILVAWLLVAWSAYGVTALGGAATDYPRFVPLLLAPFVVAAAGGLSAGGAWLTARSPRRFNGERGLLAIGLAIVLIAPLSIANYQTEAHGYQLTDDRSLAAAAAWADDRLVPGASILASVREAKWVEGLTGRPALFSSQVRYAFRPLEWDRSLAADALLRGNLTLVNESFALTMTDGAPTVDGPQPRAILVGANHAGEWADLLLFIPASSAVIAPDGAVIARLPALTPTGFDRISGLDSAAAITHWSGQREGAAVKLRQSVSVERGGTSFTLRQHVDSVLAIGGLEIEFRPPAGAGLIDVRGDGRVIEITFGRRGRTEPRLRLEVTDGTISMTDGGGLLIRTTGPDLSVQVTDLTAGGASSSLRLLDPGTVVAEYNVGAAILRRDPTYDARRSRLEALGFHVAFAEGPYIVMVRTG